MFPAMRGKGHYIGLPKARGRIRKQAGLEDVRIHDLRHSFASVGARAAMGLQVIGNPMASEDGLIVMLPPVATAMNGDHHAF